MSLNTVKTIIDCLVSFLTNWRNANNARGVIGFIILKGLYDIIKFEDHIDTVQALLNKQNNDTIALHQQYVNRDALRTSLHGHIAQFRYLVRYDLPAEISELLPKLPDVRAPRLEFLRACDATRELWQYLLDNPVESLPTPLVLEDGTTLETFTNDSTTLNTAFNDIITKKVGLKQLIQSRDQIVQKEIKARLFQYSDKIKAIFPKDDPIRLNLPTITKRNGSTPDKVQLTANWDGTAEVATLNWTPSARTDLLHYEIRACHEAPYSSVTEFAIGTVAKDQLTYQTAEGLGSEGSSLLYKVYVVTETHNERGSNTVLVVRTAAEPIAQAA